MSQPSARFSPHGAKCIECGLRTEDIQTCNGDDGFECGGHVCDDCIKKAVAGEEMDITICVSCKTQFCCKGCMEREKAIYEAEDDMEPEYRGEGMSWLENMCSICAEKLARFYFKPAAGVQQ